METVPESPPNTWHCKPCDRRMPERDRLGHLAGKFHARNASHPTKPTTKKKWRKWKKAKGTAANTPKLRRGGVRVYCTECAIDINSECRRKHVKGDRHVMNSAEGTVADPHPNGAAFIRIQDLPRIYGRKLDKVPQRIFKQLGAFQGEWNKNLTLVRKTDVMLAMEHSRIERLVQGVDGMQL